MSDITTFQNQELDLNISQYMLRIGAVACGWIVTSALAFPVKPVHIVVPYSAGGGTDMIARHLAERLRNRLGQPVVVENKVGANGIIGTDYVAKSPPDGHTYVMVVNSHLINPLVTRKMPYDTFKDLVGVTMVATSPLVFVTRGDLPTSSPKEFVDLVRKTPGGNYSYGSSESMTRLIGALFVKVQELDMVHIPYKGAAPLMTDVAAGVTTVGVTSILAAKQLITGGRLRAIGLTGTARSALLSGVPTMSESGMRDFDAVHTSYSLYAPAATSRDALERMQKEVAAVLNTPDMRELLAQQGATGVANSVSEFNSQIKRDYDFWSRLARQANLQPE